MFLEFFDDNGHIFVASKSRDGCSCKLSLENAYLHTFGWLRGTVVERRSVTGELSLSYA